MAVPSKKQSWKPRFYYIMKNKTSGKLYIGQTTQNIHKYLGSGTYWKNHCSSHGGYNRSNIDLVEYHWFEDEFLAQKWLDHFEDENGEYWLNEQWANQTQENTLDNPWFGSSTNEKKVHDGTHPFLMKNRCDSVKNAGLKTRIGTQKFKDKIMKKYGVDNIMKLKSVSSQVGKKVSKTKNTDEWKKTVEPERIKRFNKTMNLIDDNGKTKLENRNKKIGIANKEKNLERVKTGKHHYLNGFYAVLKNGETKRITKEEYEKNKIGDPESWLYVHPTSTEGKKRRTIHGGS